MDYYLKVDLVSFVRARVKIMVQINGQVVGMMYKYGYPRAMASTLTVIDTKNPCRAKV